MLPQQSPPPLPWLWCAGPDTDPPSPPKCWLPLPASQLWKKVGRKWMDVEPGRGGSTTGVEVEVVVVVYIMADDAWASSSSSIRPAIASSLSISILEKEHMACRHTPLTKLSFTPKTFTFYQFYAAETFKKMQSLKWNFKPITLCLKNNNNRGEG